ncbi:MAG TPA: TetR/AcrR family transcriptional regulator [Thermoanaerobaculia bacterium]|jgi:AcrR family transcriptional regulator|nr:TetR/AcrR family transcriptional regulator [Thermoanaerobaculia bacterium]
MPPTRTRERERSQRAILEAAEELFAESGFDRVSLAEIGEAAGVSRGLPAYFFNDKANLYRTVIDHAAQHLRERVGDALAPDAAPSPAAAVERLVTVYLDYLAANPRIVRLLQWEFLQPSGGRLSDAPEILFGYAVEALREAFAGAEKVDVDVRELVLSLVGMCLFPFMVPAVAGETKSTPWDSTRVAARRQHIVDLLLGGMKGNR